MNSVVRQLLEQNTDVVMVDTGDSYEGICGYYKGTYIAYSKEKPISMNPFKVTKEEYELNFGEKKNFLKSLIFLIFKGNAFPSKIEDMLINQTIVEYYEAYFNPFEGFVLPFSMIFYSFSIESPFIRKHYILYTFPR